MKSRTKTVALLGVCAAAAMMLSYIESFIPSVVYGVKIGLPNIVIVYLLYKVGSAKAAGVSIVRVLLTALLFGSVMSLWYSLAGAVFSLLIMTLLKKIKAFSIVGVSVMGGVAHNMAQVAVAVLITGVGAIAYYLPALIVGGITAGVFIGIAGATVVKRVDI
ncbi:MAG: Gx transporter family protein [Clostridia bacterium]|nr:Gx transporter family protein [Clostridia bacterium]MBR6651416.1 Gx transporter family protein [Clostridia bacterium]